MKAFLWHCKTYNRPPSVREISDRVGTNGNAVVGAIERLVRRGYLVRTSEQMKSRSVTVNEKQIGYCPYCGCRNGRNR